MDKKIVSRRTFMVGCGVLTFSTAGIFFTGCGGDTKGNYKKPKELQVLPPINKLAGKKVVIEKYDKVINISKNDFDILQSRGYIEAPSNGFLIFSNDGKFYGYSDVCPHDKGQLKIDSSTKIKCTKHLGQFFNNGKGNGFKTSTSLILKTLDIKVA